MIRKILLIFSSFIFSLSAHAAAFQFGGIREDLTSISSAASTTTLTKASTQVQRITGTSTQTIKLPDATTLAVGMWYLIKNQSTGLVTIVDNTSQSLSVLLSNQTVIAYLAGTSSAAGTWSLTRTTTAPLSTKGQLLVTDGSTLAALTVGSDNQVLTADSAQTYGVKWASGGGGGTTKTVGARIAASSAGSCNVDDEEGTDWINGTPTSPGTGRCVLTWNSGIWASSTTPACTVTPVVGSSVRIPDIRAINTSNIEFECAWDTSSTANAEACHIICSGTAP